MASALADLGEANMFKVPTRIVSSFLLRTKKLFHSVLTRLDYPLRNLLPQRHGVEKFELG